MKSKFLILSLGGLLFGANAHAGVVEYTNIDGNRTYALTDASCKVLKSAPEFKAKCIDSLKDFTGERGPGGGIILAKHGKYVFEVDPKTRSIYRVTVGDKGEEVARDEILRAKKLKKARTFVIGYIQETDRIDALINGKKSATKTEFVIEIAFGTSVDDLERFRFGVDVNTLRSNDPDDDDDTTADEEEDELPTYCWPNYWDCANFPG